MSENKKRLEPFVKWAGGKRVIIDKLKERVPKSFDRYIEPLVGGGALFFALKPYISIIFDANEELINAYQVIKTNVDGLIDDLKKHKNTEEYFLYLRGLDREQNYKNLSNVKRASRLIFLNHTCYNGLYRVNLKNQFNVPYGHYKNPSIFSEENLRNVSDLLKGTIIICDDFSRVLEFAKKGDFIYFDPPYLPLNKTSSFTSYTKDKFDLETHIRLKEVCDELDKKEVNFMVSNSNTAEIHDLYKAYNIEQIYSSRYIGSKGDSRGKIREIIIRNY
ncbi:MAG: DNA adenine methylase [Bdellovibrionota bacterium]